MQNVTFTTVNTKGQLVIPKAIRKALGITPQVHLTIMLNGQGIIIQPVERVVTKAKQRQELLKVLELTRGAWGPQTQAEKQKEAARRKMELAASKRRKAAW